MTTKIDLINRAYSRLRISGLTVQPTPEDTDIALDVLEDMANQWGELMDSGYTYEENPDPNTPHNIPRPFWPAFKANLAVRLSPYFNLSVHPELRREASMSYSMMCNRLALTQEIPYPTRHPVGSGNRSTYSRYQNFYIPTNTAPLEAATVNMVIGDIENFYFDFNSELGLGETVSSYTIEADNGLVITADSLSSPRINFTIRADGSNSELVTDEYLRVKVVATFSTGRIQTRLMNFVLKDADINS